MLYLCNLQGNVGLSGKPGPKVKNLENDVYWSLHCIFDSTNSDVCVQGQDGMKGDKGSPGSPGNPGEPGLRGKDVSKSAVDVTAMCYF